VNPARIADTASDPHKHNKRGAGRTTSFWACCTTRSLSIVSLSLWPSASAPSAHFLATLRTASRPLQRQPCGRQIEKPNDSCQSSAVVESAALNDSTWPGM